jgi:hypothetical protein
MQLTNMIFFSRRSACVVFYRAQFTNAQLVMRPFVFPAPLVSMRIMYARLKFKRKQTLRVNFFLWTKFICYYAISYEIAS